jgi:hypothetical protein
MDRVSAAKGQALAYNKSLQDSAKEVLVPFLNKSIANQKLSVGDAETFMNGYMHYLASGVTPHNTYLSTRTLYFNSLGMMPHYFRLLYNSFFPPRDFDLFPSSAIASANVIADNGYLVLPGYFQEQDCLQDLIKCLDIKAIEEQKGLPKQTSKVVLEEAQCIESPLLSRVLDDNFLMAVVEAYLGSRPIVDLVTAWRLCPMKEEHTQESLSRDALMFHVDLDRVMFLKLFVYLNEVGDENGPHCYIPGTHLERLPLCCTEDRRYSDQELQAHSLLAAKIKGAAGTVIVADTHCLHKGTPPVSGHRDIFQVEFSLSLFGASYSDLIPKHFPHSARDQQRAITP